MSFQPLPAQLTQELTHAHPRRQAAALDRSRLRALQLERLRGASLELRSGPTGAAAPSFADTKSAIARRPKQITMGVVLTPIVISQGLVGRHVCGYRVTAGIAQPMLRCSPLTARQNQRRRRNQPTQPTPRDPSRIAPGAGIGVLTKDSLHPSVPMA
jgi:hypothetical protein